MTTALLLLASNAMGQGLGIGVGIDELPVENGRHGPACSFDCITPTITGPSDIISRRSTLINQVWGSSTLPTTLPTVTSPCVTNCNALTGFNYSRIDQYTASMSNGQSNTSNLYVANTGNNGRVVIINPGHQLNCTWGTFSTGYMIDTNPGMVQALLADGYSVFAMNMPTATAGTNDCGDTATHNTLMTTYGETALQYFLEPAVQAMNYWDAHASFTRYDFVGLSGGGWTGALLPALDTRITRTFPVAGSMPGILAVLPAGPGDDEQNCGGCSTNFYKTASYLDLYVMGAYGSGREVLQILNFSDDCCFGQTQYNTTYGMLAAYGVSYSTYINNYTKAAQQLVPGTLTSLLFSSWIDTTATQHQISATARPMIISWLDGATCAGNLNFDGSDTTGCHLYAASAFH